MNQIALPELTLVIGVLIVYGVLVCIPVGIIFRRAGWAVWLSLLGIVPLVNIVLLWAFALGRWKPEVVASRE